MGGEVMTRRADVLEELRHDGRVGVCQALESFRLAHLCVGVGALDEAEAAGCV